MLVESMFEVIPSRSTPTEVTFVCPQPSCSDKTGNRSVNLNTAATNCWRCNVGGNFFRWAQRLGYDVQDDNDVSLIDVSDLEDSLSRGHDKTMIPFIQPDIRLPRGWTRVANEPDCAYAKWIGRMAVRKNLELNDLIQADVGFTRDDKKWERFAIFPVYEWKRLVYFQGRTYNETPGQNTKRFPSEEEVPLGSRYWVYGIDELRAGAKVAIVVESILNVLSLRKELLLRGIAGVVPVCVFKHKISKAQLVKILACRVDEVCLMFDADALKQAWESCATVINRRQFSAVEIRETVRDGKRINDANDDAVMAVDLFEKRSSYRPTDALRSLLPN